MKHESHIQKNQLYLEKMRLTDEFLTLHADYLAKVELARLCMSKAKTTHGISLFSVNSVDSHDLVPSVRIEIDENGKFEIVKEEEKEEEVEKDDGAEELKVPKDDDEEKEKHSGESEDVEEEKKSPFAGQFRPFGVLEPKAAKDARALMKEAIIILTNMASTAHLINQNVRELKEL